MYVCASFPERDSGVDDAENEVEKGSLKKRWEQFQDASKPIVA
jgi:hypothetical protein